jgi:hypothetical protein
LWLMTRDTVWCDTLAWAATSLIVGRFRVIAISLAGKDSLLQIVTHYGAKNLKKRQFMYVCVHVSVHTSILAQFV